MNAKKARKKQVKLSYFYWRYLSFDGMVSRKVINHQIKKSLNDDSKSATIFLFESKWEIKHVEKYLSDRGFNVVSNSGSSNISFNWRENNE